MDSDTPVFLAARHGAPRRGTLASGTRLPAIRRVRGDGCSTGMWIQVGEDLYACDRHLRYSASEPAARAYPGLEPGRILPYDYAFIRTDGARAYAHPRDQYVDDYIEALGRGFGVIVTGAMTYDGISFVRTRRGLWIERSEINHARGSEFVGVALEDGAALDVAWVKPRTARVHRSRGGRVVRRAGRREVVHIASEERGWAELRDGGFMRLRDLHIARPSDPPEGSPSTWIDINVGEQTLVFYRGEQPVYATLVSSGRRGRHHATPLGEHRIWVKLAYSDMDNLQREDLESNYALERVPWVQYFEGANGLHAAFWHDQFGRRKSHGCINLAPRDARAIFDLTEPALPLGWTAIFPRDDEPTTVVRVR